MKTTQSFEYVPQFRKIGKTVYVKGSLKYSDGGVFRNDVKIGYIPDGMYPSSGYNGYTCIFLFSTCNGTGSKERLYLKGGAVYVAGTQGATQAMLTASSYSID